MSENDNETGAKIITESGVTVYGVDLIGIGSGFGVDSDGDGLPIVNISAWTETEHLKNDSNEPPAVSISMTLEAAVFAFERLGYIVVPYIVGGANPNENDK